MGTAAAASYDVVVIGGGISGAATLLRLTQGGASAVLVDRFDLGTQASGRNAGSLHGQIQYDPFAAFGDGWAEAWAPCLELLTRSIDRWHRLSEEVGVDLEVKTAGGLLVAETDDQLRTIERKIALERRHGIASQLLGRDDLLARAPYLSPHLVGGELCPIEGKANPLLATAAVAAAAQRAGGTVLRETGAVGLAREHGGFAVATAGGGVLRAPRVVCAAGSEIPRLTRMLGVDLPIAGEPMQVNVTEPVAPLVDHLVYFAGGRLTLKQARAGQLLVGGGWPAAVHPRTGRPTVDLAGMRRNLGVACHVVPAVAEARLLRTWTGVNNATPDQRPVIGEVDGVAGLVVGTFPYLGFTAGPLMGELLAALALGRAPELDLEPFSPARFA